MHTGKLKRRIKIAGALLSLAFGFLFLSNINTYAQTEALTNLEKEDLSIEKEDSSDANINPHSVKGSGQFKFKRHTDSIIVGDTSCGGGDPRACAPTAVAPVPEPVTLILFGTGLALIGFKARKSLSKKD